MSKNFPVSNYNKSQTKDLFSLFIILPIFPIIVTCLGSIAIVSFFFCGLPIFFTQKRVGKNGSIFKMYKFRTMIKDAEKLQSKYKKLNEADGPVFKIRDDPRYTKFGKILSRTGLDELPQILNVLKGEMCLVGPRPLPVYEAKKLTKTQNIRLLVKPGITSSWIVNGHHKHAFSDWMKLDKEYVQNANLLTDLKILYKTALIPVNYSIMSIKALLSSIQER